MLHRGIKFAYAVLLTVSAAMAFIVVREIDETTVVGAPFVISFDRIDNGAPGPRVAEMVEAFARDHRINIGRLYNDPSNASNRRIYLSVGDPQAESAGWLVHGYPVFSRQARIELRPYQEVVNIYPEGLYFVYGPQQAATGLLREFELLGYHGDVESQFSLAKTVDHFGHSGLLWCFLIIGFVTVLAVSSAVTLNAKSYGIQRLQGQSFAAILWRDLRRIAGLCAAGAAGLAAVTVISLYLYKGLGQIATFASVALALAGVYLVAAVLAHVLTLALIHRDAIVNAVRGEVTAGWAVAGAYLLRVTAIALLFSVGTSTMISGLALAEQRHKTRVWTAMGNAYYLRIGGAVQDERQGMAIDDAVGQWIRDADARDELALAWRHGSGSPLSGASGLDVLVVNNRYLLDHEIYDAVGARVRPSGEDAVRVLAPQRHAQLLPAIDAGVTDWARFQYGRAHGQGQPPAVRLERIRDNQSILSHARSFHDGDPLLLDPVIVVVTGSSGVIGNDEYTSIASRGEILFDDPNRVMKALAEAGAGEAVLGMSPFAQEAADKYRAAKGEFGLQLFNLFATLAVLLITALALSIVYSRRHAQALFVKYLCGWGFLATHRWVLAGEGALMLLLTLWTWHTTTTAVDSYQLPGAPPPPPGMLPLEGWETVLAGGFALSSLTLFVMALRQTMARFVKTHSANPF